MRRVFCLTVVLMALGGCAGAPAASSVPATAAPSPSATPSPSVALTARATPTPQVATLIAAGDIAACDREGDSQTAALIAGLDGTVATLGDNVYPAGSDETFAQCYDPAWGAFLDRTRPALGNHDLQADAGAAYFRYFGARAGTPGGGWYSYDIGDWHVVVLNTNCELIGCGSGSSQLEWLLADLAASDADCTLAYGHHPRFSSGPHGDYAPVAPLWDALFEADADLLLVGHDHLYERFFPQTPAGVADPDGLRQITVGTGGYDLYGATRIAPNSELIIDDSLGALELTLHPDAYDWRFLTVGGEAADAGTASCH